MTDLEAILGDLLLAAVAFEFDSTHFFTLSLLYGIKTTDTKINVIPTIINGIRLINSNILLIIEYIDPKRITKPSHLRKNNINNSFILSTYSIVLR